MKNNKTKITLSIIIFLSIISFTGISFAADSSLYVSPTNITKNIGSIFNVSVGFNTFGNKVCAVEGTLILNNLTCQNIIMTSNFMAQFLPTCSNPHFLIGIPNCTTSDKVLMTLLVRAGSAGTASIKTKDVDIIGEGISVGSVSINGNYTINTTPVSPETPTMQSEQETPQNIVENPTQTTSENNSTQIEARASLIDIIGNMNINYWLLLTLVIIVCIIYGIYYFRKEKKK